MPIGKIVRIPPTGYNWGQVRDEHGNNWNIKSEGIPEDSSSGDNVAYRLDFSSPRNSPQIIIEED